MPEEKVIEKPATKGEDEEKKSGRTGMIRRVLLAYVGAIVLAEEEIKAFADRLVDKGEIAEQDGKKLIKDTMDRRRKQTAKVKTEVDDPGEGIVEKVLVRMSIPTKSDIDTLSKKLTDLSHSVEDLKKQSP